MKIYIVAKSVSNSFGCKIIAAYKDFNSAKGRAIQEPCLTKLGWQQTENNSEWHNGAGLFIHIDELEVK